MEIKNFKKILDIHFEVCKTILEDGSCKKIKCNVCPFASINDINNISCSDNKYTKHLFKYLQDEKLIESCKEFLKFKEV